MSKFYPVRCSRSEKEQRYIRARIDLWEWLSAEERSDIKRQIGSIARGGVERSALEAVALRGMSPRTAAEKYRLDRRRVYQMQREFLDGFEIR